MNKINAVENFNAVIKNYFVYSYYNSLLSSFTAVSLYLNIAKVSTKASGNQWLPCQYRTREI